MNKNSELWLTMGLMGANSMVWLMPLQAKVIGISVQVKETSNPIHLCCCQATPRGSSPFITTTFSKEYWQISVYRET